MRENIKVSIITPSFNQGQFIEETILSVLNQTYENIQFIIVDGGSTDHTMNVINRYRDKIDIIINENDNGQSDAINKGFKLAEGTLVGWLNSDDILYPNCVQKIVELYYENQDGAIFYNSTNNLIDVKSKIYRLYSIKIKNKNTLLNVNYSVIQQGSFYNREYVKKVGYLDCSLYYCMDLDLWLRLLNHGKIYYLEDDSPTSAFRIHSTTKTSTGGTMFLREIRNVLLKQGAKFFSKTVLQTLWYNLKCRIKFGIFFTLRMK